MEETQVQVKQRAVRVKEVALPDGRQGWEYSDGSIRNDNGHMLVPLAGGAPIITPESARQLLRDRWERSREAFAAGMAEGMGAKAPVDAWGRIGKKAATLLQESKSTRGFADLARFAGEAGGFVPMARGREEMQEQSNGDQPAIVVLIMQYISSMRHDDNVIDGEISD